MKKGNFKEKLKSAISEIKMFFSLMFGLVFIFGLVVLVIRAIMNPRIIP